MKNCKMLMVGMLLVLLTINISGQTTVNYPIDYPIAYFNTIGYSVAPTIHDLFYRDTYFISNLQGIPAKVTVESVSESGNTFKAQLLLALTANDSEVEFARFQVEFESDEMMKMSYVTYYKLVNLVRGQTMGEQRSYGSESKKGEIFGTFFGLMELFWDMNKLNNGLNN